MREILTIFMDYCGNGIYPFLFLAALVYLLVTEKDKRVRLILAETSVVILVLFFFPLFKMVMDRVEEAGTYYRILWLLPMTVVTAYAGVKLIGKHTRIGLVALAAVCILGGSYVYGNVNVSKAENRYHLPAEVPAICDLIMPAEDEERVWAVFPSELVQYIRQYTSEIQMPYGRDMLVARQRQKNAAIKSHSFNRLRPYNAFIYIYGLAVIGVRAVSKESHYRNF